MKITKKKSIKELKKKQSLVCLTAYTRPIAELVDKVADIILVGDSLGQVLYGFKSTREVTLDLMILHAKAVCKYATSSFVVVDLPYGTYEKSKEHAYESADRIISETGASGVKIEGGEHLATTIEYLIKKKINVMGHIGMLPQSVKSVSEYKVFGKSVKEQEQIIRDIRALEGAGVFSVVIEATIESLARKLTNLVEIPTIGIGASVSCRGQILVTEDLIGLTDFKARFLKNYCKISSTIIKALEVYKQEVKQKKFPKTQNIYK